MSRIGCCGGLETITDIAGSRNEFKAVEVYSLSLIQLNDKMQPADYQDLPSWYAVHVRSNFENRVATELGAKGVECYVPAVKETHAWTDRKKVIEVPLFPGYVFTRFYDSPMLRHTIIRSYGAVRILGHGREIEAVPNSEIEAIQRLILSNVSLLAHPLLREGALVRIRRGPLKNLEGLLVRIKTQARLVLSVELLCRSVSTEVDLNDVEPLRGKSAHSVQLM